MNVATKHTQILGAWRSSMILVVGCLNQELVDDTNPIHNLAFRHSNRTKIDQHYKLVLDMGRNPNLVTIRLVYGLGFIGIASTVFHSLER